MSISGTIFGVLGSLTLSMYSIYNKKTLPKLNQEIWLLSYYNNIYSSVIFIPLILINGEVGQLLDYPSFDLKFWSFLIVGGICGFSIGWMTSLQIKVNTFNSNCFTSLIIIFSVYISVNAQHFGDCESVCPNGSGHLLVSREQNVSLVVFEFTGLAR